MHCGFGTHKLPDFVTLAQKVNECLYILIGVIAFLRQGDDLAIVLLIMVIAELDGCDSSFSIILYVFQAWDWALGFGLERLYMTGYLATAMAIIVASAFVFLF